jgi:hypothetical protein
LVYETDKEKFLNNAVALVNDLYNDDLLIKLNNAVDSTADFTKEAIENIPYIIPALLHSEWNIVQATYFHAYVVTNLRLAVLETIVPVGKVKWLKGIDKPLFLKKIITLSHFYKAQIKLKYHVFKKLNYADFDIIDNVLRSSKNNYDKHIFKKLNYADFDIIDNVLRSSVPPNMSKQNHMETNFYNKITKKIEARRIDLFDKKSGFAFECKVGEIKNSDFIRNQLYKDKALLLNKKSNVNKIEWHLTISPTTGKGGKKTISKKLQAVIDDINKELRDNRIPEIEFIDVVSDANDLIKGT